MKKILLLSVFALTGILSLTASTVGGKNSSFSASADDVSINETNFPDNTFRAYVAGLPGGADGKFTSAEIAAIKSINVDYKKISSLKGIEFFTALDS